MAACKWKVLPDPVQAIEYVSFVNCRRFFAVDGSGSTAGARMNSERAFVEYLREKPFFNPEDTLSFWAWNCTAPTTDFDPLLWRSDYGGTVPTAILRQPDALLTIQKSGVWYLVTDGEVPDHDVHMLAELAHQHDILRVPVVFVIVGSRGPTPEQTDISVGISFFAGAQDTLILFKEIGTNKIYVIAAKGVFAPLAKSSNLTSWDEMSVFEGEEVFFYHCADLDIKVTTAESRGSFPKGISLGKEWESANDGPAWVDLDLLLEAGFLPHQDIVDLLAEEAFNNLAVAYKTRRRMHEIRQFVQGQKVEQQGPKLEDVFGAATLIAKMGDPGTTEDDRKVLQEQLRNAHLKNREHYQKTIADFSSSAEAQTIRKRNQLVDGALQILASVEAAGFNAELLSRQSNRARRAQTVSKDAIVAIADLDLQGPACKGYCLICCGEDEIMSICLKELNAEDKDNNTTDFALNFPLAAGTFTRNVSLVSSQNICFQCALLSPSGVSLYQEKLAAIIPAVQYDGPNKKYIHDQLYFALTASLATGAAGIAQMFMAILDEVLRTKAWAGAGIDENSVSTDENNEALQRKRTFLWMLDQVVENTRTRETFSELGEWVKYPQALIWVAKDFDEKGVASFAVTYPIAGFAKLISMGRRVGVFTDGIVRRMRIARAVYSVTAKYLADMLTTDSGVKNIEQWKQKYLETIYAEFNASPVPRDLGSRSIVVDLTTFEQRLSACIDVSISEGIKENTEEDRQTIMRKVQIVLFWLIYHQRSHCTAQTFFTNTREREHIAPAVLDANLSVPESAIRPLLLSIFTKEGAQFIDPAVATLHINTLIPFKNPFGASVLQCGAEACGEPFYTTDLIDSTPKDIENIRLARTQHLVKVFGIQGRFEKSGTGLPEPSSKGKPPSSTHTNMHIGIARTWAELSREKRKAVVQGGEERGAFVADVRKRICKQGRGDVFKRDIDKDVMGVLPSFFDILGLALRVDGKSDEDVTVYEHDFDQNKMEAKVRWELEVMRRLGG